MAGKEASKVAVRGAVSEAITVTTGRDNVLRSLTGSRWWRVREPATIEGSTDRGSTWTVEYSDPRARIVRGAAASNESCWMIGDEGLVLRLRPPLGWQRVTPPSSRRLVDVAAIDERVATVTDDLGRRYRTTDGGQNWHVVQQP